MTSKNKFPATTTINQDRLMSRVAVIKELLSQTDNKSSRALIETQLSEMAQLAAEIHDPEMFHFWNQKIFNMWRALSSLNQLDGEQGDGGDDSDTANPLPKLDSKLRIISSGIHQTLGVLRQKSRATRLAKQADKRAVYVARRRQHNKSSILLVCRLATCRKVFIGEDRCRKHEASHLALKPFHCAYIGCNFSVSVRDKLMDHIRSTHFTSASISTAPASRTILGNRCFNIVDQGDPEDYVMVDADLLNQQSMLLQSANPFT